MLDDPIVFQGHIDARVVCEIVEIVNDHSLLGVRYSRSNRPRRYPETGGRGAVILDLLVGLEDDHVRNQRKIDLEVLENDSVP